jgi:site-specific recombinase XerD
VIPEPPRFGAAGRRPPNFGRKLPPTLLQPEEVVRLLDACGGGQRGPRNRALITVLYRAGPLIGEALALKLDHVDLDRETLAIKGGRQAERVISMDPKAWGILGAWLALRREMPGDHVFCTFSRPNPGGPLASAYFREFTREIRDAAGLSGKRVHPQAFRHSLAAELLLEGWPLPYIQAQLGIVSLYAMERFLEHLNIRPPPADEVRAVIQTRSWDV